MGVNFSGWVSAAIAVAMAAAGWAAGGEIEIRAVDQEDGKPVAVRMHLTNQQGRSILPKGSVQWKDHFVFAGKTVLELPPGTYTFEMERGPEYHMRSGYFVMSRGATDNHQVQMQRFVHMAREGWYSGDLHIHRRLEDVPLLMEAEDLHVAPVITWWNKKNCWQDEAIPERLTSTVGRDRFYNVMAGEDERAGGALLYFNLDAPLDTTLATREFPSPVTFLKKAHRRKNEQLHVDIEKPFWWDMPIWVASGMTHSMGLCHNHLWRNGVLDNEAWGKPRDTFSYPSPDGNGRWSQEIYYRLLNCGLRIPPSAGSASGVLPNPVGYNRVYVYCGEDFTYENWWAGLRAGRVVVTNGPMLRPRVNGELPGHVFTAKAGDTMELAAQLNLSLREKVKYLEIVKDGEVVHEVRLEEYAKAGGRLPAITFDRSGWMLIRAVTDNPKTFRFASTGPYYVEIGERPRISREAVQFFLDWVHERARQIKLVDPEEQRRVLRYHRAARDFWQRRLAAANAD